VASAAGFHTAVTGARSIPGRQTTADPVLESELRFYGTFYAAYGLASGYGPPLTRRNTDADRAGAGQPVSAVSA
jgi:hypothetical protein